MPLATVHDDVWNPGDDEPNASWGAALELVGGPAADALRVFAGNSYGSAGLVLLAAGATLGRRRHLGG